MYRKFAMNHRGVTLVAATNVGLSQKSLMQAHRLFDNTDVVGDAGVGTIGAVGAASRIATACALLSPSSPPSARTVSPASGTDAKDAESERSLVTLE